MGTFIEAGLIKDGDKYVITYVDFPDSKEYQNFCADFIDYAERNDIKDYNKNAYIEYIRKQKQQAAERYPIAAPESDPSSGLTSSAVADIQSALKALGYLENPSGAYDSATRAAIEMFQEDNALPSDGIAGDETLALLLSDSAKIGRLRTEYTQAISVYGVSRQRTALTAGAVLRRTKYQPIPAAPLPPQVQSASWAPPQ